VAIHRGDVGGDDGFVVMQGKGVAEVKKQPGIARGKFLHLAPGAAEIAKDVSGACARMAIDGCPEGADKGGVAADCDRFSKAIARGTVARSEFLRLGPDAAGVSEDINSALRKPPVDNCLRRADENGGTVERDGKTEVIKGCPIVSDKFLGFRPYAARVSEDVNSALGGVAADGGAISPDDECVAINRDRGAEVIEEATIARGELLGFVKVSPDWLKT
jgi:hypothetical protein